MDIKKILENAGIEESLVNSLATTINAEIPKEFVKKEQYNKKVNMIDSLQEKINDFEAKGTKPNEWETKYNEAQKEIEGYKVKEINTKKLDLINKQLEEQGFEDDKIRKLITNGVSLNDIEIEEDNLKGFDIETISNEYASFKSKEIQEGAKAGNPPVNKGGDPKPKINSLKDAIQYMNNKL